MKKLLILLAIVTFALFYAGCSGSGPVAPPDKHHGDGNLSIRFVYVGQAEATVITSPDGYTLLYDAATGTGATDYIIPLMDSLNIDFLDMAIMSHYDGDHIGGIDEVLNAVGLDGLCYDHGGSHTTNHFTNYIAAVGDARRTISPGDTIRLGDDVQIACIASDGNGAYVIQENDRSVACIISYAGFDVWIGGDINGSDEGERVDIESRVAPDCRQMECFLADHHGSRYSNNETILAALRPDFCVISCGIDNPYGHPHAESIARMQIWTEEILRTDESGTVTVIVDSAGTFDVSTQH